MVAVNTSSPLPYALNQIFSFEVNEAEQLQPSYQFEIIDKSIGRENRCLSVKYKDRKVNFGLERQIVWDDGSYCLIRGRHIKIGGPKRYAVFIEVFETLIGFEFERRGAVRLHGLGVNLQGQALVIVAEAGFGKSYFAQKYQTRVFAEEVLYIKNGKCLNSICNLRLKNSQGGLATLHGNREVYQFLPVQQIAKIQLAYGSLNTAIKRSANLLCDVLLGRGLQQNPEYSFTFINSPHWIRIVLNRFLVFVRTPRDSKIYGRDDIEYILNSAK